MIDDMQSCSDVPQVCDASLRIQEFLHVFAFLPAMHNCHALWVYPATSPFETVKLTGSLTQLGKDFTDHLAAVLDAMSLCSQYLRYTPCDFLIEREKAEIPDLTTRLWYAPIQ